MCLVYDEFQVCVSVLRQCMYACVNTCIRVYVCLCVYVFMYASIYVYTGMYTRIQADMLSFQSAQVTEYSEQPVMITWIGG